MQNSDNFVWSDLVSLGNIIDYRWKSLGGELREGLPVKKVPKCRHCLNGGGSDPGLDFCEGKENFLLPLSKIESRKRNGNYQIFEIEREISLSTLDFSLESETLVNACFISQWVQ